MPRKFSDAIDLNRGGQRNKIAILRLELLDENKKTIASFSPNEKYIDGQFIQQHSAVHHGYTHDSAVFCDLMSIRNPFSAHSYFGGCFDFPREYDFYKRMSFLHTKKIFPYYAMIDSEKIARIKEIKIFFEHAKNRK